MISIALYISLIALGFGSILFYKQRKFEQEIMAVFGKAIALNIAELDPKKRYIISLPQEMSNEEIETAFKIMKDHLDLENSDTHVVLMQGNVRIVEFS